MLSAVLHNKAGRWFAGQFHSGDERWQERIERSEDALTAVVFDMLFLLETPLLARIISDTTHGEVKPDWLTGGEPDHKFWPSWTTGGEGLRVEPDVVIVQPAARRILVIECKHYAPHTEAQLLRELTAAQGEFQSFEVIILAFGGDRIPLSRRAPVVFGNWSDMLESARKLLDSSDERERRVLRRIIQALEFFGYRSFTGFSIQSSIKETPLDFMYVDPANGAFPGFRLGPTAVDDGVDMRGVYVKGN